MIKMSYVEVYTKTIRYNVRRLPARATKTELKQTQKEEMIYIIEHNTVIYNGQMRYDKIMKYS